LLALREYGFPLLLAAALHALTVFSLYSGWSPSQRESRIIKPQIVHSTLVMMQPKVKPKPIARPPAPKAVERVAPKPKPKTAEPVPDTVKAEPEPDPQIERRAEEERQREERLKELVDDSFAGALADEDADLTESNAASEAEVVAQSFRYGIYQRLVANWSRPPSARNGMQAKLQVELVPTGDVVAVTLLEGSGNAAFDRSAEAAVHKSRRFEVPLESEIFERYFRRFTLLFKPEDLLR
jgi:TonB family protein